METVGLRTTAIGETPLAVAAKRPTRDGRTRYDRRTNDDPDDGDLIAPPPKIPVPDDVAGRDPRR